MVKQYPHFLFVKVMSAESVQDESGNWSTSEEQFMLHTICREETNGKGHVINGPDGKSILFSSVIYMPKTAARLTEGTEVVICETNDVEGVQLIKKPVLKFDSSQLHCRLWL